MPAKLFFLLRFFSSKAVLSTLKTSLAGNYYNKVIVYIANIGTFISGTIPIEIYHTCEPNYITIYVHFLFVVSLSVTKFAIHLTIE